MENQVVYLSSQLTPLLWPCFLSFLLFLHSLPLSTSLRGSTSINNPALSCHTLPSKCVCVRVCVGVICLPYTQRNQTSMQVPCFVCRAVCKYTTFWTHWRCLCMLPFGHWQWLLLPWVECVDGCSVVWLITSAGVLYTPPSPVFVFLLTSSPFPPYIIFHGSVSCPLSSPHRTERSISPLCHTHTTAGQQATMLGYQPLSLQQNKWGIEKGGGGAYVYTWTWLALYEDVKCCETHVSLFAVQQR